MESATHPINTQNHIPTKFKQVFNANTQDRKVVLATRKILTAVTATLDSVISQRLTSVSNLLTSLITAVVESLHLLLVSLHENHTKDHKKLLEITSKSLRDSAMQTSNSCRAVRHTCSYFNSVMFNISYHDGSEKLHLQPCE